MQWHDRGIPTFELGVQHLFRSKGDSLRPYVSGSFLYGSGDLLGAWANGTTVTPYQYFRFDARLGMYLGITEATFLNAFVGSPILGFSDLENPMTGLEDEGNDDYIGINPYVGVGLAWTF